MPWPANLAELPDEVKRAMRFVPVETLEQVLAVALPHGEPEPKVETPEPA